MDQTTPQAPWRAPSVAARTARTLAALLCLATPLLQAAPVTGSDDAEPAPTWQGREVPAGRALPSGALAPRSPDRAPGAGTSTGNKNLDLLLELQARPGEAQRPVAERPALTERAAAAAAAALAAMRAQAVPNGAQPSAGPPAVSAAQQRPAPAMQPFEAVGALTADTRAGAQPERREWKGQLGGGIAGGGAAELSGAPGGTSGIDQNHLLLRLPREVIAFVRDNRYLLLAGLAVAALLAAGIKIFNRRI